MDGFKHFSESILLVLLFITPTFVSSSPIFSHQLDGNFVVQDSIAQAFNSSIQEHGERYRMTLGPGNSVYVVASNSSQDLMEQGRSEMILHKWDYQANPIWTRVWAPNTIIRPNAIATDASGIIITGIGFDDEVWVGRWSLDGNLLWYKTWNESYWQEGVATAALSDGSILVGCLVRGPLVADHTYNHSIVLLKYTSSGNLVWSKTAEWILTEDRFIRSMEDFQIYAFKENIGYFSTPYSLFEVIDNDVSHPIWSWNTSSYYNRNDLSPDGIFYSTSGLNVIGRTVNDSVIFNITFEFAPWQYLPEFWGIRGWKNKTVFVLQSYQSDEKQDLLLQKYDHHGAQFWNRTLQYGGFIPNWFNVRDFLFSESGCAYLLIYGPRSDAIFLDLLIYEIEGPCEGYLETNDLSPLIIGAAILGVLAVAVVILSRRYILNRAR